MRIPKRRGEEEKRALAEPADRYVTAEKIERMRREVEDLEKNQRPEAAKEVRRLAEMGDLSENFGYQVAKQHLRRINGRILSLAERIKMAIPIVAGGGKDGKVAIGSTVTLEADVDGKGTRLVWQILGSQETNPARGRISYRSPIGVALLGHVVGDVVTVASLRGATEYRIIDIR